MGALKSRDLTTQHQVAGVDIARLVLMCEYLFTTIFSACHVAREMTAKSGQNSSSITEQKH